jgi:SAM-dependent methyltransferase
MASCPLPLPLKEAVKKVDELAQYNKSRWEALAQARVFYSRPFLNLTETTAYEWLQCEPLYGRSRISSVAGKDVLILGGGGGQQSAVFALLGARVTVLDLSETQLARDQEAAVLYGKTITTLQGDMRDLSLLAGNRFDIIWQPYSINFVPDASVVLREAGRVIRPGGFYHLTFANPFWSMDEGDWTGKGYPIRQPYISGDELKVDDPDWTFTNDQGQDQRIKGPREFMHTFSDIINGLLDAGFMIIGFAEGPAGDVNALPGSWEHMVRFVPPFLSIGGLRS